MRAICLLAGLSLVGRDEQLGLVGAVGAVWRLSTLIPDRTVRVEFRSLAGDRALRRVRRDQAGARLALLRQPVVRAERVCRGSPVAAVPYPRADLRHPVARLRPGELRDRQILPLGV